MNWIQKIRQKINTDLDQNGEDTGLRGTFAGRLYVDKSVFYRRQKVIETIEKLKLAVRNSK